jgi:hypothetical protein
LGRSARRDPGTLHQPDVTARRNDARPLPHPDHATRVERHSSAFARTSRRNRRRTRQTWRRCSWLPSIRWSDFHTATKCTNTARSRPRRSARCRFRRSSSTTGSWRPRHGRGADRAARSSEATRAIQVTRGLRLIMCAVAQKDLRQSRAFFRDWTRPAGVLCALGKQNAHGGGDMGGG